MLDLDNNPKLKLYSNIKKMAFGTFCLNDGRPTQPMRGWHGEGPCHCFMLSLYLPPLSCGPSFFVNKLSGVYSKNFNDIKREREGGIQRVIIASQCTRSMLPSV